MPTSTTVAYVMNLHQIIQYAHGGGNLSKVSTNITTNIRPMSKSKLGKVSNQPQWLVGPDEAKLVMQESNYSVP